METNVRYQPVQNAFKMERGKIMQIAAYSHFRIFSNPSTEHFLLFTQ